MSLRQAAEMALKYFEDAHGLEDTEVEIKEALRQALAKPEMKELTAHDRYQERQRIAQEQHIKRANMKIYCELCKKVQPVQIDNGIDVETKKLYQDIVCGECNLIIASGTDISPPKKEWVGLDGEIPGLGLVTDEFYNGMIVAEDILRERNT